MNRRVTVRDPRSASTFSPFELARLRECLRKGKNPPGRRRRSSNRAIARLIALGLPGWWVPLLKFWFTISHVLLARGFLACRAMLACLRPAYSNALIGSVSGMRIANAKALTRRTRMKKLMIIFAMALSLVACGTTSSPGGGGVQQDNVKP
ncbi:MAG: hypothetical protein H0V16_09120 [Burkholderiaceae bacterium]|nr:hypothetical protein [Burkholderiaceae bacterium]